jgi:hypothetical protein
VIRILIYGRIWTGTGRSNLKNIRKGLSLGQEGNFPDIHYFLK